MCLTVPPYECKKYNNVAVVSVSKAQEDSNDCDQQKHEDQAAVHCPEGKTCLPLSEGEQLCDNGTPLTVPMWKAVKLEGKKA